LRTKGVRKLTRSAFLPLLACLLIGAILPATTDFDNSDLDVEIQGNAIVAESAPLLALPMQVVRRGKSEAICISSFLHSPVRALPPIASHDALPKTGRSLLILIHVSRT